MNLYMYKMTVDDGGAPCVKNGELSLAICKPVIRRLAEEGSWIFGFAGSFLAKYTGNPLIYVAQVNRRVPGQIYYAEAGPYRDRADCTYEVTRNGYRRRGNAAYHSQAADLQHDLGRTPDFPNAWVLTSQNFRYFGNQGPCIDVDQERAAGALLNKLTRGHRVNMTPDAAVALVSLRDRAFSTAMAPLTFDATPIAPSVEGCGCWEDEGLASNLCLPDED